MRNGFQNGECIRAFRRSKTVSNIPIQYLIASDETNTFCVCVWIHYFSTKSTISHKLLVSSEVMTHCIGTFDTVLERPKVILLLFESHRTTPVILGNTYATYEAYYFKRALNEPILVFFQFFVILEANISHMTILYISFFISRTFRNFC